MSDYVPPHARKREWAVISRSNFRGQVQVYKGGLATREKAWAALHALTLELTRRAADALYEEDAHVTPPQLRVVWREVPRWRDDTEPE